MLCYPMLPVIKFAKFYYCWVWGVLDRRARTPHTQQRRYNNVLHNLRGRAAGPRQRPKAGPLKYLKSDTGPKTRPYIGPSKIKGELVKVIETLLLNFFDPFF